MNAFYYQFESTGVPEIDAILKEVANAGLKEKHTNTWVAEGFIDKIQLAANEAANSLSHPESLEVKDSTHSAG